MPETVSETDAVPAPDDPHRPRYDAYVGFVSPPASCDYSVQQFLEIAAPGRVAAMQTMLPYLGAEYSDDLPDAARRLDHLRDSVRALSESKLEVILQVGGYWALPYGPTLESARTVEAELTEEFGVPVVLNWTAIADALAAVDAQVITMAAGYYRPLWIEASIAFFESAGIEVAWAGDVVDLGLVADDAEKRAIEAATNWDYPDELVLGACVGAAEHAPDVDAVCQTGSGMRTPFVVDAVERATGLPLVATDLALYWAALRHIEVGARPGTGRLLATVSAH